MMVECVVRAVYIQLVDEASDISCGLSLPSVSQWP